MSVEKSVVHVEGRGCVQGAKQQSEGGEKDGLGKEQAGVVDQRVRFVKIRFKPLTCYGDTTKKKGLEKCLDKFVVKYNYFISVCVLAVSGGGDCSLQRCCTKSIVDNVIMFEFCSACV